VTFWRTGTQWIRRIALCGRYIESLIKDEQKYFVFSPDYSRFIWVSAVAAYKPQAWKSMPISIIDRYFDNRSQRFTYRL